MPPRKRAIGGKASKKKLRTVAPMVSPQSTARVLSDPLPYDHQQGEGDEIFASNRIPVSPTSRGAAVLALGRVSRRPQTQEQVDAMLQELIQSECCEPTLNQKSRRIAIAFIFENAHGGEEESEEKPWKGAGGVMPLIRNALNIQKSVDIEYILHDYIECKKLGVAYSGERIFSLGSMLGRPPVISLDSIEAQIIVDAIEEGGSIRIAHSMVNEHRRQMELESICNIFRCPKKLPARTKGRALETRLEQSGFALGYCSSGLG